MSDATRGNREDGPPADAAGGEALDTLFWDGFQAGAAAALVVALWFLILDLAAGHPLHTPAVLGTALLEGPEAAAAVEEMHADVVALYSVVHLAATVAFAFLLAWGVDRARGTAAGAPLLLSGLLLLALGVPVGVQVAAPAAVAEAVPLREGIVGGSLGAVALGGYLTLRNPSLLPGREIRGQSPG